MSRFGYGEGYGADDSGREYGSRRQKVFGYLKAANDLRQAYTSSIQQKWQNAYDENGVDAPGAFPDADIARSGDEEMVIFPSYARRHVKRTRNAPEDFQPMPGTHEDIDQPGSPGDINYWKQEWEKYEDDNAIVDVDVRGWLYMPQRGAMNRKHRLLIALARKLSGIPAPTAPSSNPIQQNLAKREDEDVTREAQSIINKGEHDADVAWRSNRSGYSSDSDAPGRLSRVSTNSLQNKDNLSVANARLMERLRPFMNNPTVGGAITLFFFNDEESQSRTTLTDDSGHFNIRTALEFVPTHVKILASESLSVTEEIRVIEPRGVSLISDVDDTIKHSAIASGAKEIFRNTFVRELDELTIDGVREWYNKLADMGVDMHYVSNSPWQIYPLMKTYFKLAGLPRGSFHLKQYSGMLQGIFEPTAERKRVSLEKIMRDFPERKFILVGDSGEADLEVYTEVVQQNSGKVLGVFIRDVTTTEKKDFFDTSFDQSRSNFSRTASPSVMNDRTDSLASRPALPPRQPPAANSSQTEDLITFDESSSDNDVPETTVRKPPVKPSKPSALRTATTMPAAASEEKPETIRRKPAPPLPDKPRRLSTPQREGQKENTSQERVPPLPQRKPTANDTYTNTVKNMAVNAYNNIPSTRDTMDALSTMSLKDAIPTSQDEASTTTTSSKRGAPPPPPPPRRAMTNTPNNERKNIPTPPKLPSRQGTPLSLSSSSSNPRLNNTSSTTNTTNPDYYDSGLAYNNNAEDAPPQPLLNKREELWKRRWERAQQILSDHGVLLGSWRVGSDAQDITTWLVEDSLKKIKEKKQGYGDEKM